MKSGLTMPNTGLLRSSPGLCGVTTIPAPFGSTPSTQLTRPCVMRPIYRGLIMSKQAYDTALMLSQGGTVDRKDLGDAKDIKLLILGLRDIERNCKEVIKQLEKVIKS